MIERFFSGLSKIKDAVAAVCGDEDDCMPGHHPI
jgi:hypothetical protein